MVERKLGLTIGVNDYSDPKLSNLLFAKKDAEEMRKILLNPDIGGFDEIVPLVNETKYNVKKGIEKLLLKDATSDDLVLIYFSGHGKLDFKFELNLLLKDTETDYLLSTALNYSFITDCIEQSKCKKTVTILDCCHGGAAGIKGDISKTLSESSGSGTFILCATTGSNLAKEVQELENGIFTYYLLEGLRKGDADLGGDGLIDILELYEYVSKKCNDEYSQVTTIKSRFEERIVIGKNPLKVKQNEFIRDKNKLNNIEKKLPVDVFTISLIALINTYEKPEELTENDKKIRNSLRDLLVGRMSVETYIHTVQCSLENEDFEKSYILEKYREEQIPKTFTSPTGIEFVLIPAGKFMMGSPSDEKGRYIYEGPIHEVIIKNSFYMGKYQVTQRQWEKLMGNNPSDFKGEDLPVESISWNDVQEFIKIMNEKEETDKYRLPSEAEWEYTCRAGTTTRYSFDESKIDDYIWYYNNSSRKTHPVGQKKPNLWGFYDMHGNVLEWVQDSWHSSYHGAPSDGSAWEDKKGSERIFRGGCWSLKAGYCRSAVRLRRSPKHSSSNLGFRLVRIL